MDVLQRHFEPKLLVIMKRHHFHRRDQRPGESIADFVADARRLTVYCEFGPI